MKRQELLTRRLWWMSKLICRGNSCVGIKRYWKQCENISNFVIFYACQIGTGYTGIPTFCPTICRLTTLGCCMTAWAATLTMQAGKMQNPVLLQTRIKAVTSRNGNINMGYA